MKPAIKLAALILIGIPIGAMSLNDVIALRSYRLDCHGLFLFAYQSGTGGCIAALIRAFISSRQATASCSESPR